jgi:phosphatidylglycerol lysyltransferase
MMKTLFYRLSPLIAVVLLAIAIGVLQHELKAHDYHDIARSFREIPGRQILLALGLTIVNYLALTGYDVCALYYIQRPLGYGKIALASFIGYVFSYNIGLSIVGGSAVRFRLYSAWGLSAVEIAKVVAYCTLAFWVGVLTIGGVTLLIGSPSILSAMHLPLVAARLLGLFILFLVGGYLVWGVLRTTPFKVRGWELTLPSTSLSLTQLALSTVDWILAGSVCYVLLPAASTLSYAEFLGVFMLAQVAGTISHVPGGLGVFESVMLLLLAPTMPAASIMGALLAYRVIFYLLPLGAAVLLLGIYEVKCKKEEMKRVAAAVTRWAPDIAPRLLSLATFLGGAILFLSGAIPEVMGNEAWFSHLLPLHVVNMSHFLGSMVGMGLLLLAWGLQRRLDAAYLLTVVLLGVGILACLLKGLDPEETIMLTVMLGALLPCRQQFYRKASLISQRLSPGWIAAIVLVLCGSIWLGVFSHKYGEFSGDVWWQWVLSGDAPRFLRASVGAVVLGLAFATASLLRPATPKPAPPSQVDLDRARPIIAASPQTSANLALLGDKSLLFSDNQKAFLMYSIAGRSWVVLGDPIGPPEEAAELAWRWQDLCDRYGGWPVFYQVQARNLPLYIDLGLTLLKLGEEARVPLTNFSLDGSAHRWLRHVRRHLEGEGCTFEVVPADGVPPVLAELQRISDAWLMEKNTREKGFSLGFFTPDYLKLFPIGIVRREGKLLAFANLWLGGGKEELSVDLMRHLPDAPHGVMDYLFLHVMLWGAQQGYQWFNLGMAPLSGLEDRALAPLWNRLGALVFHHGEHFYNFQGLRQYKAKFDPQWEPKYLAFPGGLTLPRILTNIAALISGGLKGVLTK